MRQNLTYGAGDEQEYDESNEYDEGEWAGRESSAVHDVQATQDWMRWESKGSDRHEPVTGDDE